MNSESLSTPSTLPSDAIQSGSVSDRKRWPESLKRQPSWIRYTLLGATGLLITVGGVVGYQSIVNAPAETVQERRTAIPVATTNIEKVSSYQVPRIYTGEITALRTSRLGFDRGGELIQVLVDEGQSVSSGQTLARLDIRNLKTQRLQVEAQKAQAVARLTELQNGARSENIAEAEAAVRDLENQLTLQETQEQRREYLYERGAIAREQLDEFSFGANSLQARLDQARSRLEELRNGTRFEQVNAQQAVVNQLDAQLQDIDVNISKSTITAPYDGIVAERKADEGTVLGRGQAVLELVESATPEVRVGIPSHVVNKIQVGSSETVRVNEQPYRAEFISILPEVDQSTRTQTVVLKLDAAAIGKVEPGQTARLTIVETIQSAGFWLPRGALTQGIRGLWTCYVVVLTDEYKRSETAETFVAESEVTDREKSTQENGFVVEQRSVEIVQQETFGDTSNSGIRVLVRGTLQTGDQVVTSGVHRLVPGQSVTIAPSVKNLSE